MSPAQLGPPADINKAVSWNPTDTEKALVRGVPAGSPVPKDTTGKPLPDGGCSADADRQLAGGTSTPPDENLGNQLSIDTFKRSENDSRVRSVMSLEQLHAALGVHVQSIWDPNDKAWPEPANSDEIATAKANVANGKPTWSWCGCRSRRPTSNGRSTTGPDLAAVQTYIHANAGNAARIVGG